MESTGVHRREFLASGVGLAAAALTSARAGAVSPNDTINVGLIGCGVRGTYLLGEAMTAGGDRLHVVGLCDVWSVAREKLAQTVAAKQGQEPALFDHHQALLAMPGLDAVIIATPDFAHCAVLMDAVNAGKDAYVEKPLCARLEDAIAAHDLVKAHPERIVQVGTQRRSSRYFQTAAAYVKSGALGQICKIETAWNRNVPSWARPYDMVRESDVNWAQYQMYLAARAFDARRYRCWQLYYEHTSGLVGLLGSHMIDVALWFMDDPYPSAAVALGDVLSWKDGREISDTAEYVFEFPKGWILTFSSRLGSGPESDYEVFYGKERTLDSRDWISRPAANPRDPQVTGTVVPGMADAGSFTSGGATEHVANWVSCLASRTAPNAPIEVGLAHAVVCCLGREAERTGRKVRYDPTTRKIIEV